MVDLSPTSHTVGQILVGLDRVNSRGMIVHHACLFEKVAAGELRFDMNNFVLPKTLSQGKTSVYVAKYDLAEYSPL